MTSLLRRIGTLGAALGAVALPGVASAQQSELTRGMGIEQRLGERIHPDIHMVDDTGATRTFDSLLKGRPLLIVPIPLRRQRDCLQALDALEKTLYKADNPNKHVLIAKAGSNRLRVGSGLDIVLLSVDPDEGPSDAAAVRNDFSQNIGYAPEGITPLTGSLADIHRFADAIGFKFYYDPATKILRNPTGSALLTPDGRISAYTIGNDFPTIVLERNVETAAANRIGVKADETTKFACVQLDSAVIARRGKIESILNLAAAGTIVVLVVWIGSMLRQERLQNRNLAQSNPGGRVDA